MQNIIINHPQLNFDANAELPFIKGFESYYYTDFGYNPAIMPVPAEWVTARRIKVQEKIDIQISTLFKIFEEGLGKKPGLTISE